MNTTTILEQTYSIAEVVAKTGVSAHTLRYYERISLLDVGRQANGHRRFTEHDILGVVFIGRLRATAMPIREIQRYFALVAAGSSTEGDRLALLQSHRLAVRARLNEVEEALGVIEHKIARYGGSRTP